MRLCNGSLSSQAIPLMAVPHSRSPLGAEFERASQEIFSYD
jgi:hypothetical protein